MFKRSSRVLLVTLLLFVLAGATYAFAATNSVDDTYAGDGSGTITGFNVTNIEYEVSGENISSVTFDVTAQGDPTVTAGVVQVSFDDGTNWETDCTINSGVNWTCDIDPTVTVLEAVSLRVIAVQ